MPEQGVRAAARVGWLVATRARLSASRSRASQHRFMYSGPTVTQACFFHARHTNPCLGGCRRWLVDIALLDLCLECCIRFGLIVHGGFHSVRYFPLV